MIATIVNAFTWRNGTTVPVGVLEKAGPLQYIPVHVEGLSTAGVRYSVVRRGRDWVVVA